MKEENKKTAETKLVNRYISDYQKEAEETGATKVIRFGDAPKLLDEIKPNKIRLAGIISAPAAFYGVRKSLHDKDKCHVLFDFRKGTILLVTNETFETINIEVLGSLIKNPDLADLKINQKYKFGVKELMETLKFNRLLFLDPEENAKIVLQLQNFKVRVDKTIEDVDNNRGAETKGYIQKLEMDLKEQFVLDMPIYKGGRKYRFVVEILCQITDKQLMLWLDSRDLKEIELTASEEIIKKELEIFSEIVCIEQ